MPYNRDNFIKIRREFEGKNLKVKEEAAKRTSDLYDILPDLKKLDDYLSEIGLRLFNAALQDKKNYNERAEKIKKEYFDMIERRKGLLRNKGYPEDYTDVKYECDICSDTGYNGINMCVCMKKALIEAGYKSSGIGHLMKKQSFETFKLDYYKHNKELFDKIEYNYQFCKDYAEQFTSEKYKNLLLFGDTGLGKTHLSTAIAKVVIENGYDVMYNTAQNIFEDFQYERFSRSYQDTGEKKTNRYFDCDLLIIDDLGTEMPNQFTISCLYNLVNTRINIEKSTIINTNLKQNDLRKIYADRITSRLFGEFAMLAFCGTDIRELKLRMKN